MGSIIKSYYCLVILYCDLERSIVLTVSLKLMHLYAVIFSRILYLVAPSMLSSQPPSGQSVRLTSKTMKMAKAYQGEPGKDFNKKSGNLSSTLEKLYAWEKKLYKEVKVKSVKKSWMACNLFFLL